MPKQLRSYLLCIGITLLIAVLVFFSGRDRWDTMTNVCNGLFISSVLVGGYGLLAFANKLGTFDMFSYAVSWLINLRWPWIRNPEKRKKETYGDYKMRKSEERSYSLTPLIVGGATLLLSIVAYAITL